MAPTSLKFLSFMLQLCITYPLNKTHLNSWRVWNRALQDSLAFPLRDLLGSRLVLQKLFSVYPVECLSRCTAVEGSAQHSWLGGGRQKCKIAVKSGNMCSSPAAVSRGALKRLSWKKY